MQTVIQASRSRRVVRSSVQNKIRREHGSWRVAAVAMTLGCTLSACGGGGGGSTPATPASKATAPAPTQTCASLLVSGTPLTPKCHLTIYMVGDSTNWGVDVDDTGNEVQSPGVGQGLTGRANPSPIQLLQTWADQTYGPGIVGFIDGSIPGSTLPSDLNGTPPSTAPLATRLASLPIHADIVMTNSEINDQYVLGETVDQYVANLQQWIGVVVQYGAVPIYMEPNPISVSRSGYVNYSAQIGETNQLVYNADVVFSNAGYPVLGNLYEWENDTSPPNASPWNTSWMSSDGVHPNDAGYAAKESNYFNGAQAVNSTTNSLKAVINSMLAGINP